MSQCDQLAALLSDGRWWTTRELLREVPCTVHSRIADLRKRGLEIQHETVGVGAAGSRYRLVKLSAGPDADRDALAQGVHPQARTANGVSAASLGASQAPSALTRPSRSGSSQVVIAQVGAATQLSLTDAA